MPKIVRACLKLAMHWEKPSTGPIGSWGILSAVKNINEAEEGQVTARTLLCKKGCNGLHHISIHDDADRIAALWDTVRTEFSAKVPSPAPPAVVTLNRIHLRRRY